MFKMNNKASHVESNTNTRSFRQSRARRTSLCLPPCLMLVFVLLAFASPSRAANSTWSGLGTDANWSTSGNWDVLPASGSDLTFTGTANSSNNNDLLATLGKVSLNSADWVISGNPVTLKGTLYTSGSGNTFTWNVPTTLSPAYHSVLVVAGSTLTLDSLAVPADGGVSFYAPGAGLGGATVVNNLNGSPIAVTNFLGGWADTSDLITFSSCKFAAWDGTQITTNAPSMTSSATTNFTGALPTDNCWVDTTAGNTVLGNLTINSLLLWGYLNVNNGALVTLNSGGLLIGNGGRFATRTIGTSSGTRGQLTTGLPGGQLYMNVQGSYPWVFNALIKDNGATPLRLIKNGYQEIDLSSNSFSGGTVINSGVLGATATNSYGTGAVTVHDSYGYGGTAAPGQGQAYLNAAGTFPNDFNLAGTGLNPSGTLNLVNSAANVAGTVTLAGNANIGGIGTISGQITDNGNGYSLTKADAGALTLTSSNFYSGGTVVSGGGSLILNTNNAIGSGPILLTNNSLLVVNASNALGTATLSPNSVGAIQINQPSYVPGTVYLSQFMSLVAPTPVSQTLLQKIDPASSGSIAMAVSSANNLDFAACPNVFLGAISNVTYSGTLTPQSGRYLLGGGGMTSATTNNGLTITTLTGANDVIVGRPGIVTLTASDNYSGNTTISNSAWVNLTNDNLGQIPGAFLSNNVTLANGGLIFHSNLVATTINLSANRGIGITTGGTFTIWTNTTVAVNGTINGSGSLTKSQNGILMLNGNNSGFSGSVTNSGGILVVGSPTALGTNPAVAVSSGTKLRLNGYNYTFANLSANAGTIENGAAGNCELVVKTPTNSTFSGSFTNSSLGTAGTLKFRFQGPGTLSLGGKSGHTGGTSVEGGTLKLTINASPVAALSGSVTVLTNAVLQSQNLDTLGYAPNIGVTNLFLDGGMLNHAYNGRVSLSGCSLMMRGGTVNATNTSAFLNLTNNSTIVSLASSVPSVINATKFWIGQSNLTFDVASGGAPGGDLIVNGPINQDPNWVNSLTKLGAGVLVLSQMDQFSYSTGPAYIYGGKLVVGSGVLDHSAAIVLSNNATIDMATMAGGLLNNPGQPLSGSGNINGSVVLDTALTVGDSAHLGKITSSGSFTLASTCVSTLKINRASTPAFDSVSATDITLGGALNVTISGEEPRAGDSFKLFNASGSYSGDFATINLPTLPGRAWSWNAATGTLSVSGTAVTTPPLITASASNFIYHLSWPADHTGWRLEVQTNSLSTGLGTNWITWPGSSDTNVVYIPISMAAPSVFYRLVWP
jgi:autotransporter-associated beta strand protein